MTHSFKALTVKLENAIATITIDNGPINILDMDLIKDLYKAGQQVAEDDTIKVVIIQSANPDFFIAHADVNMIMAMSGTPEPDGKTPSMLQQMFELYRHMPKITIGKIEGIARGGGSELLLALDMRFAAMGKARLGQPEVALGLIAGGGGCTRLPKLMGRGRAMEVLLGCEDFDAQLAERYGYVNRAIPADEIDVFVNRLAKRMSKHPAHAIALTKQLVNANESIQPEDLGREFEGFYQSATHEGMGQRMRQAMASGLQTPEAELRDLNEVTQKLE